MPPASHNGKELVTEPRSECRIGHKDPARLAASSA